VLLN
jgi:hypothetical protein